MIEFLKENRKNDLENQTITTLLFSKSREMIEIDVLFIIFFGIIKRLL